MGQIRSKLNKLNDSPDSFYLIALDRHVLLLDSKGETVVDTDPRKFDRRRVVGVWIIEGYKAKLDRKIKSDIELDLMMGVPKRWAGLTVGDMAKLPLSEVQEYSDWLRSKGK